jgi:dolichol-phosphate mannosyltransferase
VKTWIILPTFNEADNIVAIVQSLLDLHLSDSSILIVDDGSPDGTGLIADHLHQQYPDCVQVLHRGERLGLGTAYLDGFGYALQRGAEALVQMDADFSHSPQYLPLFLDQIRDYDVVVGSRYVPGGRLDARWSWWRYLLSWWANSIYVRLILGLKVRDATAGFKCFRAETLRRLNLDGVRSNGYVFQVEMAYLCEKHGCRILEIAIYFEDRRIGHSKMTVPVKLEAAWRVWQILFRYGPLFHNLARVEWQRETA